MKDKKISIGYVLLAILVLGSFIVIGTQAVQIKTLKQRVSSFFPGEVFPELDVVTIKNEPLENLANLKGVSVVFLFKTPCSSCNSNLNTWNRLSQFFGKRIKFIGIIPNGELDAVLQMQEKSIDFQLYYPVNVQVFNKKMHYRFNVAQTIVVSNGKVKYIEFGNISTDRLDALMTLLKKLVQSV